MCRIFAFRSIIPSKVHTSLLLAENSLYSQSERHPDGWGVAYYVQQSPHLIRSTSKAIDDQLFQQVSGLVSSETVIAHLRKATEGQLNILNTHPFQFGKWVFVHNGHVTNFLKVKESIQKRIPENLRRFILGNTDSETIFFFFMSYLMRSVKLDASVPIDLVVKTLQIAMEDLKKIIGEHATEDSESLQKNYLTFLLTNGETMVAYHGGKNLNFSTYKSQCGERESCSYYQHTCENPDEGKIIQHLVFSSEDVHNENIWQKMSAGDWVGVDHRMVLLRMKG